MNEAARLRRPAAAAASLALGALAFVAFFALGSAVSQRPPQPLDVAAHALFYGHGVQLAAVCTQAGRFPAYVSLCVLALVFGFVRRAWLWRAAVSVVVLAAAWRLGDLFKDHFERLRPAPQLVFFEPSYAYASGHATLALTFYGGWALFVWRADLPPAARLWTAVMAGGIITALCWSRLALGAHWLTDVVGGLLLGTSFVTLQAALAEIPMGTRAARGAAPRRP